jgi:hypothetical protein
MAFATLIGENPGYFKCFHIIDQSTVLNSFQAIKDPFIREFELVTGNGMRPALVNL